jgi:hypothetical protein
MENMAVRQLSIMPEKLELGAADRMGNLIAGMA